MILLFGFLVAALTGRSSAAVIVPTTGTFAALGIPTGARTGSPVFTADLNNHPASVITAFRAFHDSMGIEPTAPGPTGSNPDGGTPLPIVLGYDASAQRSGFLVLGQFGAASARFEPLPIQRTLTTSTSSPVHLVNGHLAGNDFWQTGSPASPGANNTVPDGVPEDEAFTPNPGPDSFGRAFALNGPGALDNRFITASTPAFSVPEPSSLVAGLLCAGIIWWERSVTRRRRTNQS